MFVRILSLIRLARVSRLVRFFNEVEKVCLRLKFTSEIESTFLQPDTLQSPVTRVTLGLFPMSDYVTKYYTI